MKKTLALLTALALTAGAAFAETTLKVGATPEPHAEILNLIKEEITRNFNHINRLFTNLCDCRVV